MKKSVVANLLIFGGEVPEDVLATQLKPWSHILQIFQKILKNSFSMPFCKEILHKVTLLNQMHINT